MDFGEIFSFVNLHEKVVFAKHVQKWLGRGLQDGPMGVLKFLYLLFEIPLLGIYFYFCKYFLWNWIFNKIQNDLILQKSIKRLSKRINGFLNLSAEYRKRVIGFRFSYFLFIFLLLFFPFLSCPFYSFSFCRSECYLILIFCRDFKDFCKTLQTIFGIPGLPESKDLRILHKLGFPKSFAIPWI